MKIWCLFTHANVPGQPDKTMACWWSSKPTAEIIKNLGHGLTTYEIEDLLKGEGWVETDYDMLYKIEEWEEGIEIGTMPD